LTLKIFCLSIFLGQLSIVTYLLSRNYISQSTIRSFYPNRVKYNNGLEAIFVLGAIMGKDLVLEGCGHAHLKTLLHCKDIIKRGHRAKLISPSSYLYYSGMGPGFVGGTYSPAQILSYSKNGRGSRRRICAGKSPNSRSA
jgi:hypothetical protein